MKTVCVITKQFNLGGILVTYYRFICFLNDGESAELVVSEDIDVKEFDPWKSGTPLYPGPKDDLQKEVKTEEGGQK